MAAILEETQKRVRAARDKAVERGDGRPETLTVDERRVLEHFWNAAFHAEVPSVPAAAIYFNEGRRLRPDPNDADVRELVTLWIKALMNKGYLQPDFSILTDMATKESR